MFASIVSLELSKQKRTPQSVALVLALTVAIVFLQALVRRISPLESVQAVLMVALFAIPLLALVFGCASAAGLRNDLRRAAEEMLPFRPLHRVLGAYLTSAALLALCSAALVALNISFNGLGLPGTGLLPELGSLVVGVLYLHLLAFAITYWVGQPLLGAGLAGVASALTGVCFYGLTNLMDSESFYADLQDLFSAVLFGAAICIVAGWAALTLLAGAVDRSARLRLRAAPAALALALAPLLSFAALLWSTHTIETRLYPLPYWNWIADRQDPGGHGRAALHGSLFTTGAGSIVRIDPQGKRQLLLRAPDVAPFDRRAIQQQMLGADLDGENRLWVLLIPDLRSGWETFEIRRALPGGVLEPYTTFRSETVDNLRLVRREGVVSLCGSLRSLRKAQIGLACAAMPERGKLPVWKELPTMAKDNFFTAVQRMRLEDLAASGNAAVLSEDGKVLHWDAPDGAKHTWQIPGATPRAPEDNSRFALPVYTTPAGPVFSVTFAQADSQQRILLCFPDGSTKDPWNHNLGNEELRSRAFRGGRLWITGTWQQPEELLVISDNGTVSPAQSVRDLMSQSRLPSAPSPGFVRIVGIRLDGTRLWLLLNEHLVAWDLEKKSLLHSEPIDPESPWLSLSFWPSEEGMYFLSDGRIRLLTWDGEESDLGEANVKF